MSTRVDVEHQVIIFGWPDRIAIARVGFGRVAARIAQLTAEGFTVAPSPGAPMVLAAALQALDESALMTVWRVLFGHYDPVPFGRQSICQELCERAQMAFHELVVLERRVARGWQLETLQEPAAPPPPVRTDLDHWLVLEARDDAGAPVANVRAELVIAGGETFALRTGPDGRARRDQLKAARAVVRVLHMDGSRWREKNGAATERSSNGSGGWHVVRPGDSVATLARANGLKSWKELWRAPQNESLRKRRTNPNVIFPGDEIYIPGANVRELTHATDATCSIVVERACGVMAIINADLIRAPSALAATWPGGSATVSAGHVMYSDSDGIVVAMKGSSTDALITVAAPEEEA